MSLPFHSKPQTTISTKNESQETKTQIKKNTIRILTYNVNFGSCYDESLNIGSSQNTHHVLNAILESNADVVCLQETHRGWEAATKKNLSQKYPTQHYYHPNEWLAGGSAILLTSNYQFENVTEFQPEIQGSYFKGMGAQIRASNNNDDKKQNGDDEKNKKNTQSTLSIVNAHLRPPLPMGNSSLFRWKTAKAYWFETPTIRRIELQQLVAAFNRPHIIVGDFNEASNGEAHRWIVNEGYKDALSSASTHITWYWPVWWKFEFKDSYDHIMYDSVKNRCHLQSCAVMTKYKYASDHLPVVATIDWE